MESGTGHNQVSRKWSKWLIGAGTLAGVTLLTGCGNELALDPQGPGARTIAESWWILYWTAVIVTLVVFVLLGLAIYRRRSAGSADQDEAVIESRGKAMLVWGGGVIPLVILIATTFFILLGMRTLEASADNAINIRVTGHMFWWELEYLDEDFATANELHIPVGQPVRLELESADVIHSFWVPQLQGKMELVPGRTNELMIQADAPGSYSGYCAEFCGQGHSFMQLVVVAQMPDEYEAWASGQAEDAAVADGERAQEGARLFQEFICSNCHTVRGVSEAAVEAGPDLTHLASRGTLAARAVPNTRSQLANWILDPQDVKPGANMPSTPMTGEELDALIAFFGVGE